jgi:hypothetical protein
MKKAYLFSLVIIGLTTTAGFTQTYTEKPAIYEEITNYLKTLFINEIISTEVVTNKGDIDYSVSDGKLVLSTPQEIGSTSYYIPTEVNHFFVGDINGDFNNDIIAPVYMEFGAGGSSIDYYIYLYQDYTYTFYKKISKFDLGEVARGTTGEFGEFTLTKIYNNELIGNCEVWTLNDPRCCPSLHYRARISLVNGMRLIKREQYTE